MIRHGDALRAFQGPDGRFKRGTHWRAHAIFREREYLKVEYLDKKRSAQEIADEHGVTRNAIYFWLSKHGIPGRSMAETRRLKHWGISGSKNPMHGRTGPLNPRFIDGSSPERQRLYVQGIGRAFLAAALKRDGHKCARCGAGKKGPKSLHVHHIKPWAGNKKLRFNLNNVITLCRRCHCWVHSNANLLREFLR